MKTAYFIIVHHKLNQFRWLFEAIYSGEDLFCIHADRKSGPEFQEQLRRMIGPRPNVIFLPPRRVIWGGWRLVAVELEAIRHLLAADADWKYYINLSGQDYPIKPLPTIKEILRAAWPRNFIRSWPFSAIRELEPDDPHLPRQLAFEAFGRLVRTRYRLPFPRSLDIRFKGSNWHMLTREFCCWLLEDPLSRRVARMVRYTFIPDEIFFQAVIMNSPFREMRTDFRRFVIWPGPKILGLEDYPRLLESDCLFGRKFDENHDRRVLQHLADDCGYRPPEPPIFASR
ncbi:glycosyl transferase [Geobacter sp. SVR]|nr:glycosyl transferase [Geobacter sp. SVR]GCF86845.1 glycosyl transferase [Geobacter sp. SVR]